MTGVSLVVGTIGMICLLAAFVLNVLGRVEEDALAYLALNLVGGVLLMYYAVMLQSVPFLVLETVWAGVAAYKIVQSYW